MKPFLINTFAVTGFVILFSLGSLALSFHWNDAEWFQASGAVLTLGGVVLIARKLIRLGLVDFMTDEQTVDDGSFPPTLEEKEAQNQFEMDMVAYKWSFWLLIVGTLVWAYGGIVLRLLSVQK